MKVLDQALMFNKTNKNIKRDLGAGFLFPKLSIMQYNFDSVIPDFAQWMKKNQGSFLVWSIEAYFFYWKLLWEYSYLIQAALWYIQTSKPSDTDPGSSCKDWNLKWNKLLHMHSAYLHLVSRKNMQLKMGAVGSLSESNAVLFCYFYSHFLSCLKGA